MIKYLICLLTVLSVVGVYSAGIKTFSELEIRLGNGAGVRKLVFDYSPDADTAEIQVDSTTDYFNLTRSFDVSDTTRGSTAYPVMTEAQRDLTTPAEGQGVYNSTAKTLNIYDGSSWVGVGSGGGAGSLDTFVSNNYDSTVIGDFSSGNNASFDGGGSLVGASSIQTGVNAINGAQSIRYVAATGCSNDYLYVDTITLSPKQKEIRKLGLSFPYNYSGIGVSDGDIKLIVWDDDNNLDLLDGTGDLETKSATGIYKRSFSVGATTNTLKIGFQVSTCVNGSVLNWDDLQSSTDLFLAADFNTDSDWESFTPTGTWTSNVTYNGRYRQDGPDLVIQYYLVLTGSPSPATNLNLNLPDGFTADTSKILNTDLNTSSLSNNCLANDSSASRRWECRAGYSGLTNIAMFGGNNNSTLQTTQIWERMDGAANPFAWASGDTLNLTVRIPVTQFSSFNQGIVTPNTVTQPAARNNTSGATVANSTITYLDFPTEDFDDDSLFEGCGSGNVTTSGTGCRLIANRSGKIMILSRLAFDDTNIWGGGEQYQLSIYVNGTRVRRNTKEIITTSVTTNQKITTGISGIVEVQRGDYVEIGLNQTSGSAAPLALSSTDSYFDAAYTGGAPDFASRGVEVYQDFILSSDVTADGSIADFAINNLTVGNCYFISGNIRGNTVTDSSALINVANGAQDLARIQFGNANGSLVQWSRSPSIQFKATGTTVSFTASSISNVTINGDGTKLGSYIQITEKECYETSKF